MKDWMMRNRRGVLLTFAGLNTLICLMYAWMGDAALATIWAVLAVFMFWDAFDK